MCFCSSYVLEKRKIDRSMERGREKERGTKQLACVYTVHTLNPK